MFERFLTNAINTHFGHLVEGADKISLSAWSGELVLHDLSLRRDALNHWLPDCPVEIAYGRIGNLEIRIPWKLIRSQLWTSQSSPQTPCSVVLTDVNILVTPRKRLAQHLEENNDDESSEGTTDDSEQRQKLEEAVENVLDAKLLQRVASKSKTSANAERGWLQARIADIVSNVSVKICNIHIRYEDPGNSMGFEWNLAGSSSTGQYRNPFAIGLLLKEFSLQSDSSDEGGKNQESTRKKVAAAHDLASYWDSGCVLVSDRETHFLIGSDMNDREFFEAAFEILADGTLPASFPSHVPSVFQPRHSFVLSPFSPSVLFTLQSQHDGGERARPPSSVVATLPPCHISISRDLLEDIGYLRKSFAVWANVRQGLLCVSSLRRLARLRPGLSPMADPRSWWRYAFEGVLAFQRIGQDTRTLRIMKNRSRGWLGLAQALGRRRRYVDLYRRFLLAGTEEDRHANHLALQAFEQQLLIEEIVAFRMNVFSAVDRVEEEGSEPECVSKASFDREDGQKSISAEHRMRTYLEMASFLSHEDLALAEDPKPSSQGSRSGETNELDANVVLWTTSLKCPEFSVQLNDKSPLHSRQAPAVGLSCAFMKEQRLYVDGSWDMTNRVGDLIVKDCSSSIESRSIFPNLVGPKGGLDRNESTFWIDDIEYQQSVLVRVCRQFHVDQSSAETGSTTTTEIRVLPLEIVFIAKPVEAMARVLSTTNIDFSDDYHRMVSRLSAWKERQQQRLLNALAHKRKTILVDVDVGAPVLLLPEEKHWKGLLLVVDLGRLQCSNDEASQGQGFDDNWRLELDDVQMLCCPVSSYREITSAGSQGNDAVRLGAIDKQQRLVEPFSLNFSISTAVTPHEQGERASVRVMATLPRLAFNVTSSAVRLVRRLREQWQQHKRGLKPAKVSFSGLGDPRRRLLSRNPPRKRQKSNASRRLEFNFVAPLLRIRLENDVDGRDCSAESLSTPLFDLGLSGMEASIVSERAPEGTKLLCGAKVGTLVATDLYQHAGDDFSLIVSSVSPHLVSSIFDCRQGPDMQLTGTDLVTFDYISNSESKSGDRMSVSNHPENTGKPRNEFKARFHELYVEWNPETVAAVHKAVGVAKTDDTHPDTLSVNDTSGQTGSEEFFDAEEDDFFDAESVVSEQSTDSRLISEISSSVMSSYADLKMAAEKAETRLSTEWQLLGVPNAGFSRPPVIISSLWPGQPVPPPKAPSLHPADDSVPFIVIFDMFKLSVNFNKEARHRRVLTAEMDGTHVTYSKIRKGVTQVRASIGNLTLADPSSAENQTLYREVLGLQTDTVAGKPSSLLELEFNSKTKARSFAPNKTTPSEGSDCPVFVDLAEGSISGYDNKLEASLSPMRFVYLQQLWFEIVDYFFEGIIGYEVWGSARPPILDPAQLVQESPEETVKKVPFTLFHVTMDAPVIIVPVACCSTDFARLEATRISISNHYTRRPMRSIGGRPPNGELMQWYNNCHITIGDVKILSSGGRQLSTTNFPLKGDVRLNWPTGATATMNVPKWNVRGSFDKVSLALHKEDFALLQHIVGHNVGGYSRHMDEWIALSNLSPAELERYCQSILVHFGYDQKDVRPSTFDVQMAFTEVNFGFEDSVAGQLAAAKFDDLRWSYQKHADLISRQKVCCGVEIASPAVSDSVILLRPTTLKSLPGESRMLVYSSTYHPSGDSSKRLEILSPRILANVLAWKGLSRFFQGMPDPTFLSPNEVIQVGDRWYRIGETFARSSEATSARALDWIPGFDVNATNQNTSNTQKSPPNYKFSVNLMKPCMVFGDEESSLGLAMDTLHFTHHGKSQHIRRRLEMKGIELRASSYDGDDDLQSSSLIEPWSVSASIERCNGQQPCTCPLHSVRVSAGKIQARALYSDMSIATNAFMIVARDLERSIGGTPSSASDSDTRVVPKKGTVRPKVERFHLVADGLFLAVVDDSGRHFAGSQELMVVTSETFDFRTEKVASQPSSSDKAHGGLNCETSMHLRLHRLDVIDCLQAKTSPFRLVLSLHPPGATSDPKNDRAAQTTNQHGLEFLRLDNESSVYSAILGSVEVQYNPSMIIALQRLLGRLSKHFHERQKLMRDMETFASAEHATTGSHPPAKMRPSRGTLEIRSLSVCLNKEHQGRQLLQTTVTNCQLDMEANEEGSCIRGFIGAIDSSAPSREGVDKRELVKACSEGSHFVDFRYRTFTNGHHDGHVQRMPEWLQPRLKGSEGEIDDYLEVSVTSMTAVLHREHTEELIDYLSNGFPGRGMGATSRAAKGFVTQRIQKRSFLHVSVDNPRVFIPEREGSSTAVLLQLGDLKIQSWIEHSVGGDGNETCRRVASSLSGLECGICTGANPAEGVEASKLVQRIDITVDAEKAASTVSVRAVVSDVRINLSYTDYVCVVNVVQENLTKPIDRQAWDNLEAKWEEEKSEAGLVPIRTTQYSTGIAYATSARHVRYGQSKRKASVPVKTLSSFKLSLGRLSVVMKRDGDHLHGLSDYEMLFLQGQGLEASAETSSEGDMSLNCSLREIFVFDLGETGRSLMTKGISLKRRPRRVSVMVEGYSPPEKTGPAVQDDTTDSLVLKIDKESNSADTKVAVVMSCLSIMAMQGSLQEIAAFLSRSWPHSKARYRVSYLSEEGTNGTREEAKAPPKDPTGRIHCRFVLHYPRLIVAADELDPNSRALVLRGLAIATASHQVLPSAVDTDSSSIEMDSVIDTKINADFQNISSYINPDVSWMATPRLVHLPILGDRFSRDDLFGPSGNGETNESTEDLNVPLLLPLTMAVEFEQASRTSAVNRALSVSVDPLSIFLGSEDLQLVRSVADKWSSNSSKSQLKQTYFDAVFQSERLGLGLRKDGGAACVDNVKEPAFSKGVQMGDAIYAVNGVLVFRDPEITLSSIVDRLSKASRPLTITFSRFVEDDAVDADCQSVSNGKDSRIDVDITFSRSVLTLVEKDFPLARGEMTNAKVTCGMNRTNTATNLSLAVVSTIGVNCYNLGIWGWEPFLEQGKIAFSAEYQDPTNASRQLNLEFSDGHTGLAVNITDASAETASKIIEWGKESLEEEESIEAEFEEQVEVREDKASVSRNAANAALLYARRQKHGTARPFIFRNRTGLSVAFVQQKCPGTGNVSLISSAFLAVGEYSGLESYEASQITEVANGAEIRFRVEVDDDLQREPSSCRSFPLLTVSLQTVGGVEVEAFTNLSIHRPGETLLPLRYYRLGESGEPVAREASNAKQFASWLVEQIDEKTVITLGSSLRVFSALAEPLEIGVGVLPSTEHFSWDSVLIKTIGSAYPGQPFFLPLWLAMQGDSWCCGFKLDSRHKFSPLFYYSDQGSYDFGPLSRGTVGCIPRKGMLPAKWLSTAIMEDEGVLTLTLDSLLSLRNLLPTDVEWEVTDRSLTPIDGSAQRSRASFGSDSCVLRCGEKVEVLARSAEGIVARFRPRGVEWSTWVSLSLCSGDNGTGRSSTEKEPSVVQQEPFTIRYAQSRDSFGVEQNMAVRLCRKDCGIDVTLFAELWCANHSTLDLTFGYLRQGGAEEVQRHGDGASELTPAEVALKEISSLFESNPSDSGKREESKACSSSDAVRLPCQTSPHLVEDCFEYVEVVNSSERRWWASENPRHQRKDLTCVDGSGEGWYWIDSTWELDRTGRLSEDGWESSQDPNSFAAPRIYHPAHRYRRRRWFRKRSGLTKEYLVSGVHAFFQARREPQRATKQGNPLQSNARIAIQVNGGQWALSAVVPHDGAVYGAIRARSSRWPQTMMMEKNAKRKLEPPTAIYELCYSIAPLDGPWGEVSRFMMVSSRFLIRNDSKRYNFEVKQAGASDGSATRIKPGETSAFHWADCRRPELISVRPAGEENEASSYSWSGGFDPLTIGALPLRVKNEKMRTSTDRSPFTIRSVRMEAEIRPKTGGTGINLSFEEEEPNGDGALFRIENRSAFPVWISQDGMIANPSTSLGVKSELVGYLMQPSERSCFSLDVPFRQGKYSGRKAASMDELLRVRLALAPLTSHFGIETTKVLSLAKMGDRVRLNPSKLMFLDACLRTQLDRIRVLGVVENDGPTTVLTLRLMEKDSDNLLVNPFSDDSSMFGGDYDRSMSSSASQAATRGALKVAKLRAERQLPTEEELCKHSCFEEPTNIQQEEALQVEPCSKKERDLQISLRVALRGLVLSLVDSAPSEIAVVTLKNLNAIAAWNISRTADATVFITVTDLQVDNMIPNAPFPVAISAGGRGSMSSGGEVGKDAQVDLAPVLVAGLSFAPKHKTGTVCLKSVTVAPRNLAIRVDLAFLVRLQKFAVDLQSYFRSRRQIPDDKWPVPDLCARLRALDEASLSGADRQKYFFGGLTILPCNIRLSVAPARALNPEQALLEGVDNAALHQAVRKGDVRLDRSSAAVLGVSVGRRNKTALAVVRGMFKSFVVDALLRLDGASINLAGVSLRNHVSTGHQLSTQLGAHYLSSLRLNVPALLGSLAAIGNPIGLVRGLGDGVSDFVLEPVKGFQRSVQEMDASHLVDGVARGTLSLARHTVGGFADSAAMLTETFSKNMVVLTLDRRYAQKRDRGEMLRDHDDINVALGLGSGVQKLVTGFLEGVTGVVKAPIRGAEKKGLEGFAKGIGKGLLGLLVKPIIGISDGISDVFIGVKGTVDGASGMQSQLAQLRPRRALYGRERVLRPYNMADAAAAALMMKTRLAGESYLSHLDMGDRVALLSVKRLLLVGSKGEELLVLKFKHIESLEVRGLNAGWSIVVLLNTPRKDGTDVEVITCQEEDQARDLCSLMEEGMGSPKSDQVVL